MKTNIFNAKFPTIWSEGGGSVPCGRGFTDVHHGVVQEVDQLHLGVLLCVPGVLDFLPQGLRLVLPSLCLLDHHDDLPLHVVSLLLGPHLHPRQLVFCFTKIQ